MRSSKQFHLTIFAMGLVLLTGVAQASESIKTVEEMLATENQKILDSMTGAKTPVINTISNKPTPPTVSVQSIYGPRDALQINLTVNGVVHENLKVGSTISGCTIKSVANQCVTLEPSNLKKTSQTMCPSTCWTGVEPVRQAFEVRADAPAPGQRAPLPAGFPSGTPPQVIPALTR